MRATDLQAHFEAIREHEIQAREHNLNSGLTAALLNLQQFLEEEDTDAAIHYLEKEVDIKTLSAHIHTFPTTLKEKAALLSETYNDLISTNPRDPLDISARIEAYLQREAVDSSPTPAP